MRTRIALGLAVGLLFCADVVKGDEALQGTWRLSSGEADGKALNEKQLKDGKLVIKGDHYTVTIPEKEKITGTQKVDSMKTPKTIDISDDSGPNKGKMCLGIYEVKGDDFRCVFAMPGKDRPSKFSTAADSGQWLHVWKKMK